MRKIPLSKGKFAIVDDDDYEWLSKYTWSICKCPKGVPYARGFVAGRRVRMHRCIIEHHSGPLGKDVVVDHFNHNTLDNRKCNLRKCTQSQNMANTRPKQNRYKGVMLRKDTGKYRAWIRHNGKLLHLGQFNTANEAATAYNKKAMELFGEYALLNNVEDKSCIQ